MTSAPRQSELQLYAPMRAFGIGFDKKSRSHIASSVSVPETHERNDDVRQPEQSSGRVGEKGVVDDM